MLVLVTRLKWTQLIVAVATTILAGLIWPGIMVVIPVAIGVFYVISAAGALRDWKPLMWSACLLSLAVAVFSTTAVVANDFAVFRIESEMGDPPLVAMSPNGGHVQLERIPESTLIEMRRDYASAINRQRVIAALLLLISIGSCAVVVMYGRAWKWLILPNRSRIA